MAKVSSRVLEAGPDSCRVDIHQLEARVLDGQQLLPRAGAALLDELPDQLSVSTWPSQVKGVLLAHKTGAASLRDLQDGQRSRHTDISASYPTLGSGRSPMAAQTRWTSAATAEGRIIESLQNIHSSASTVEGQTAMTSSFPGRAQKP
ncbi:hypothetical protein WJX84_010337 [Apatococcus fuscideae]|uniref:Uncharacterized protein n=1 Tax=Apatococcus fuscideae TaxID=2026836 RepID=A0AAW1T2A4_9CHLO